ncbi:MAG: DUF799 family lipoprotein [Deltaproteobacteria bacterium]|nr:DUF799 family lipoprotein [Deltaproteobacteria bacterium]
MTMVLKFLISVSTLVLLAGCVPPHVPKHYNFNNPIKRVVLLPMRNDTNDVGGPDVVRSKMEAVLRDRGYNVKPVKESDQILRDQMGINLGGQLDMTTPQKLGEVLGVEGVFYGTLMDFEDTTAGVYNVKKVRAKFKFINTMTGDTIWERGLGVKSEMRMSGGIGTATAIAANIKDIKEKEVPWVTLESVSSDRGFGETMAIGLGTKLLTKAVGIHLGRESTELARRVTGNLQWGPGPGAVAAAPPVIKMPEIKMPEPPSFAYMDYGKKDFSALVVSTSVNRGTNEIYTSDIPLAKAGEKIRMDIDLSRMAKGGEMPPAISKMSTIHRGDRKISYTLYPNKQKYLTHKETEEGYIGEAPKIEKTKVGSEVIDRHPCDKYKVKITYKNGEVQEGYIWNARDLDGMTIKSEIENKEFKITTELKNIILRTPDASLFEIPGGYTEAQGFMELMMEEHKP